MIPDGRYLRPAFRARRGGQGLARLNLSHVDWAWKVSHSALNVLLFSFAFPTFLSCISMVGGNQTKYGKPHFASRGSSVEMQRSVRARQYIFLVESTGISPWPSLAFAISCLP